MSPVSAEHLHQLQATCPKFGSPFHRSRRAKIDTLLHPAAGLGVSSTATGSGPDAA